ncbi:hypothetical protein CBR_g38067 [Chara braunii]|uniref:Uncharacterized protein n=1 Tax=Chara braunii TaxID=69332 RepID=A0A388K090_CHABU|nr:hypothetical protein CBR_g38067 [Chara braunii]|eukprot:GBG63447.1 hypothetical protein CBR_g38067 [Chara braunii]
MPVMGQTTVPNMAPPAPVQYQAVAPAGNPWSMPPWQNAGQWPVNEQWWGQPPNPQPASNQQQSNQVHQTSSNQQAVVVPHNSGNGSSIGKGPTANAFPGPGNRAYFTKEYMDILEDIKMSKAVEEARKKIASGRRGGLRNQDLPDEGSRSEVRSTNKVRSANKSEEMKAWVTATLGDSLKLITEKLQEVDQKAKLTLAEKEELNNLRGAKARQEKECKDPTSNEKRKRRGKCTPVANSPRLNHVKSRTSASSKTKSRSKRIVVSSDEEEGGTVKQNLQPKMDTSSELADIKSMLVALLQGIGNTKGKAPVILLKSVKGEASVESEGCEDVDVVQNEPNDEEEEDDEGGLAAYMKQRQEFYYSLQYTRVQELCKQKNIQYFRKDAGAWELARLDLQEYANLLKEEKPALSEGAVSWPSSVYRIPAQY